MNIVHKGHNRERDRTLKKTHKSKDYYFSLNLSWVGKFSFPFFFILNIQTAKGLSEYVRRVMLHLSGITNSFMLPTKPEWQDFAVTNTNELTAESTQISAVNATKMIMICEEKIITVAMVILLPGWKSLMLPAYTLQTALHYCQIPFQTWNTSKRLFLPSAAHSAVHSSVMNFVS